MDGDSAAGDRRLVVEWLAVLPAITLALALFLVPGFLINVGLLRFRAPLALLFAAPVGGGFLGLLAYVLGVVGLPWSLWSVLGATAVLGISALLVGCSGRRARHARADRFVQGTGIGWPTVGWAALGMVVFAAIQGSAILPAMGSVAAVPTVGDAHFHLQGVRLISESGSAMPLGPFAFLYGVGDGQASPYYPTLWHSVVVCLLPTGTIVEATNMVAIAVGLILWPLSLSSFAAALRPKSPLAALVAPLCASIIVLMPGIELFGFAVYPFALSVVMLAGTMGLATLVIRRASVTLLVALALASFGTISAQPTTGLIVAFVLLIWGLCAIVMRAWRLARAGRGLRAGFILLTTAAVFAAVMVMLPRAPLVRGLNQRPTESITYREAVLNMVLGPVYSNRLSLVVTVLLVTALAGGIIAARRWPGLVMALSAVGLAILYVAAAGPESYLRVFTSPWWKDASRFAIFLLVFTIGFAAVALVVLLEWLGRLIPGNRQVIRTALGFASAGTVLILWAVYPEAVFSTARLAFFVHDTYDRSDESSIGLNEDELVLLEQLDDVLPPGTVVVGDPDSGVAWVDVLSEARQFQGMRFPQNDEQAYLGVNFANILEDERVCEIINSNDISAFLQSDSPTKEFVGRNEGFNQVDTSVGFDLLKSVGGARLYRITACD